MINPPTRWVDNDLPYPFVYVACTTLVHSRRFNATVVITIFHIAVNAHYGCVDDITVHDAADKAILISNGMIAELKGADISHDFSLLATC